MLFMFSRKAMMTMVKATPRATPRVSAGSGNTSNSLGWRSERTREAYLNAQKAKPIYAQQFDIQTQTTSSAYPANRYGTVTNPIPAQYFYADNFIFRGSATNGNDSIIGQGRIDGLEGDDLITGSQGNDIILGGGGNDQIDSGGGCDRIYGGFGNDIIRLRNTGGVCEADGGAGFDKFILSSGNGYAKILNYNPKEDQVDASQCGVGGLRLGSSGSIEILSKNSNTIALLEGSGYSLTGNLKTDCKNLGIVG